MPRVTKGRKDAPKKALTGFMFFAMEARKQVKEENPEAKFGQLGKLVGQKWKGLSEEEKAPFAKKAEEDKLRYQNEIAAQQREA